MAFLAGLFSLVDAMLDEPMDFVVEKLPVADELKMALTQRNGQLGLYLKLVLYYEQALWDKAEEMAAVSAISMVDVHEFYQESLVWSAKVKAEVST
ncbi:hypothetical protein [Catenovulum sediminis]|uniref:hypothetical protein n=1 Tax=Catenovulum sediminis TaxID=1740262 RepID=UPI0011810847|nr:hypothetical protein [Catenovulum sediminis]